MGIRDPGIVPQTNGELDIGAVEHDFGGFCQRKLGVIMAKHIGNHHRGFNMVASATRNS